MPASLTDWVERLEERPLPVMALTIQRVTRLLDSPSTNHADYQQIVGRDPGFTLSIFRRFTTRDHGTLATVGTLPHALSLLGLSPLMEGAGLPLLKRRRGTVGPGLQSLYSEAAHAASYVRHWAQRRGDDQADEMALAALLHHCGEMALWAHASDEMRKIQRHLDNGMARDNSALAVLGFTLDQLSHALAERWHLPALTRDALAVTGAFQPRPLGIMLASALARRSALDWTAEETLALIDLSADYIGVDQNHAIADLHCLSATVARQLHGLRLPAAAFGLLRLPTAEATEAATKERPAARPEDVSGLQTLQHKPVPMPTAAALAESASIPEATPELIPAPAIIPSSRPGASKKSSVTIPLRSPAPAATVGNGLQQRLLRIMGQLQQVAGLERAMFAMLTPDKKLLKARFVLGAEKDAALRRFQINLKQRNLFAVLTAKPQVFALNQHNRDKFLPLMPAPLQDILGPEGFFCASIFVNGRPFGVLYADHSDPAMLTKPAFERFQQLAQRLSNELKNGVTRKTG